MSDSHRSVAAPGPDGSEGDGDHSGVITDETLDRNWNELLQELRVTQTGVQILLAFLLTVPFTQRFTELDDTQEVVYLAVLSGAVVTTGFMVAPAAFHRVLFRLRMRYWLVEAASLCAQIGLAILALTCSGALFLVFDVVTTREIALAAFGVSVCFFAILWLVAPAWAGHRARRR